MKISTACLPFDIVTLEERRSQVAKSITSAALQECKFLAFPEFCFTQRTEEAIEAQNSTGFQKFAEAIPGGANCTFMMEQAAKHKMTIVYGTFEKVDDKHHYNTALVIGPDGTILGKHRKSIPASGEDEGHGGETLSGNDFNLIDTPLGKAGIITCYEMYFPEVARVYELKGADYLIYIHADNSETTREVAIARSRDSYLPLICSCYASTAGAYILDLKGDVAATADGPGVVSCELDTSVQPIGQYTWDGDEKINRRLMRWYQRKPELFGIITEKMDIPHPLEQSE